MGSWDMVQCFSNITYLNLLLSELTLVGCIVNNSLVTRARTKTFDCK